MLTKWTKLSPAQRELLLLVANRPEQAQRLQALHNRCSHGIVCPYLSEQRTVKALVDRGLVRWAWIGQGSPDLALSAEPAFTSTFAPLPRPQSVAEALGTKNKASTTQCLDGHGNLVGWVQDSGGDCVYAYSRAKDGTVRLAGIYQRGIDRTSFSGRSVKGNQLMRQIPGI